MRAFLCSVLAGIVMAGCSSAAKESVRLTFCAQGRTTEIPTTGGTELVAACEAALGHADQVAQLAVAPQLIERIKQSGASIELRYAEPRSIAVPAVKREVRIDRILIPLTGEFAGPKLLMIFHGTGRYESGPFGGLASDRARILEALHGAGVSL